MTEKCPFQFDLMNPMTHNGELPFDKFRTLREQCPVAFQQSENKYGEFWAISKREHVDFVSKNPKIFSHEPWQPLHWGNQEIELDTP